MNKLVTAAALALTLASAGTALAQQSSTGQSAGGYRQVGNPGQVVADERSLKEYAATHGTAVTLTQPLVLGSAVPSTVTIMELPKTVYLDPARRDYAYFVTTTNQVVLVDPATREIIRVVD